MERVRTYREECNREAIRKPAATHSKVTPSREVILNNHMLHNSHMHPSNHILHNRQPLNQQPHLLEVMLSHRLPHQEEALTAGIRLMTFPSNTSYSR